ncbi:hypothetical protein Btru_011960 [Bulinus truncatus]|nr:hypothetical protein Btru_011960 [Bulinus truncatus]
METWLIAVIASSAAVVTACIIGLFVYLCRSCCPRAHGDLENQIIVNDEIRETNESPAPGPDRRLSHWLHQQRHSRVEREQTVSRTASPDQRHSRVEREHTVSRTAALDKRLRILKPIHEVRGSTTHLHGQRTGQHIDHRLQQRIEQQRLESEQQRLRQQNLQQNFWLKEEADVVFRDPDKTLDLHYLNVEDALKKFYHFLVAMETVYSNNNHRTLDRYIHVITGRGLHSKNGIPKIKPAVQFYIDAYAYPHTWTNNGGMKIKEDLKGHSKLGDGDKKCKKSPVNHFKKAAVIVVNIHFIS